MSASRQSMRSRPSSSSFKGKARETPEDERLVAHAQRAPTTRKVSKRALLQRWRQSIGRPEVAEADLLRDIIFILQGINGRYIRFDDRRTVRVPAANVADGPAIDEGLGRLIFVEEDECCIPRPRRDLIHRLAELGWLYRKVETFSKHKAKEQTGMIEQSLCHFLTNELTDYYRLIAILESQMARVSAVSNQQIDPKGSERDEQDRAGTPSAGLNTVQELDFDSRTGLTLKRLVVWTEECRLRMRMMSALAEGCADSHGGALVSLIHSYTDHGDPFIRRFTDQLLEEVSKPFFHSLSQWIYEGELHDPFKEFFVQVNPELADQLSSRPFVGPAVAGPGHGGGDDDALGFEAWNNKEDEDAALLWQSKYQFNKDMLPAFVGEEFGRKIFSTGKSLNFIRYSCGDSDWVATRTTLDSAGKVLKYSDIAGLERTIDAAYSIASQRLLDIFLDKFKLLDHLRALKQYFMLGMGDFVDILMSSLAPSLSRPANSLYRHNLTATLTEAIRGSNAQHDSPDVLRRLDARMLEYQQGEIGWGVFTLEYKVDSPINTILDEDNMADYQKMFTHLWRLKRVEIALGEAWKRAINGVRNAIQVVARFEKDWVQSLEAEWRQPRLVLSEMIHFVRQVQAYCQLEVIECSWQDLVQSITQRSAGFDLDALIKQHKAYVRRLVSKALLLGRKKGEEYVLLDQLRTVLQIILDYRESLDDLYDWMLKEMADRDMQHDLERQGLENPPSSRNQPRFGGGGPDRLEAIRGRIQSFAGSFRESVLGLLAALQRHPDADVKFLYIRLTYNDHYAVHRSSSRPT